MNAAEIKAEILRLTREFSRLTHGANRPGYAPDESRKFVPGETNVPYAGRVFTEDEVEAAVSSTLDFWLTLGSEGRAFEQEFADFLGVRKCLLANSGSSANLLAVSALTSHKLPDEKRLKPGDEVVVDGQLEVVPGGAVQIVRDGQAAAPQNSGPKSRSGKRNRS